MFEKDVTFWLLLLNLEYMNQNNVSGPDKHNVRKFIGNAIK